MENEVTMQSVMKALKDLRINVAGLDESAIKQRVMAHLVKKGMACKPEVVIGPRCRVDILVEDGIVLELKKQRPRLGDVFDQLQRYASTGRVKGLILILERYVPMPDEFSGVPCEVLSLNSRWGIAL